MRTRPTDLPRGLLSALWITVLMQIVFRDIHQFISPGFIDEISRGVYQGSAITQWHFLFGGVILQLPIWMIALCHALPDRTLVLLHRALAPVVLAMSFLAWPTDPDDWFHIAMQGVALAAMVALSFPGRRRTAVA